MSQSVQVPRRRGRFARLALAGALMTVGATAVAPAAQADTLKTVRSHVRSADAALHQVVAAAPGGSISAPLAALEAQLKAAGHDSARLYRHAHSSAAHVKAATALTKLGSQEARDTAVLTPLVGSLSGANQTDIAGFLAAVTQGREQVLNLVTQLVGTLPDPVQGQVAGIVAQLSNAGTGQIGALAGAITPGSIACTALDAVSQVVATVLTSVQADLARVQSVLSFLPAAGQTQLTGVLNGLPAQLNALIASLKQGFNCTGTTPATDVTGIATGPVSIVTSLIGSVTQLVQSLVGSFLPGIGSGQTPAPVSLPGPVSGILGSVTNLIPGLGSLFGGSSGTGFLGGLLGGLGGLGG
jgi:hypothetical protein